MMKTWLDRCLAGGQKQLRGESANASVLGPKQLKTESTFHTIDPLIACSLESSKTLHPRPSPMMTSSVISYIHSFCLGNALDHDPHQYLLKLVYDFMISHLLSYLSHDVVFPFVLHIFASSDDPHLFLSLYNCLLSDPHTLLHLPLTLLLQLL